MEKVLSVAEAKATFDSVIEDIARNGARHYIIVGENSPAIAMLSHDEYLRLQQLAKREEAQLARFDAMMARRAALDLPYSDEEIDADIEAAQQEVRELRQQRVGSGR